jgi:hypothetical protein
VNGFLVLELVAALSYICTSLALWFLVAIVVGCLVFRQHLREPEDAYIKGKARRALLRDRAADAATTTFSVMGFVITTLAALDIIPYASLADKKAAVVTGALYGLINSGTKIWGHFVDPLDDKRSTEAARPQVI